MEDLKNEADLGSEDTIVSTEPVSIRDSLKAAMTAEPEDKGESRARDEAGRFAAKAAEAANPTAKVETPAVKTPDPNAAPAPEAAATQAPQAAAPVAKAPPGWSPEAKASFDALPPHVQAAVVKREQEIDNGFKVLQDYKGLEEFSPLVKQAGTTHAEVMRRAVDWESNLQAKPFDTIAGVANIIQQKTGITVDKILHPDLIAHLRQQPQQQRQQVQTPQPVNVEQTVEQVLRKRDTENQIQSFLTDPSNPHAEAVIDDMVILIKEGRATSLKDAYDAACWMRPDIRQQLINQAQPAPVVDPNAQRAAAADQARKASRSITGSSAPGPSRDAASGQPSTIRDSLKQAMAASGTRA